MPDFIIEHNGNGKNILKVLPPEPQEATLHVCVYYHNTHYI